LKGGHFIVSNRYLRIGGNRPPGWARRRVLAWMWQGLLVAKSLRDRVSPGTAVSG